MMKRILMTIVAAAAFSVAGVAAARDADTADTQPEASIPFANHGIRDWKAVDGNTLYVQDVHGRWYRAELMGHCLDLTFGQVLGFDTRPGGTFDRFSSVYTRTSRCPLQSLTRADLPPSGRDEAGRRG